LATAFSGADVLGETSVWNVIQDVNQINVFVYMHMQVSL